MLTIDLTITKERSSWHVPTHAHFRQLILRSSCFVRLPKRVELSLAFIGDGTMRTMNARYRGKHRTTDVLSFAYTHSPKLLSGDILIAVRQARRQARMIGQSLAEEIQFLFVHGLLHLLGYDHEKSKKEEQRMFDLQKKILRRV